MEQLALEAIGVSKTYNAREVLSRVNLATTAGRIHGLLGPNGAGKTTLLRILFGLVRRNAGTIRLLGQEVRGAGGPLPDGVAGFVDAPTFYPYLSGRENLALLACLDGTSRTGVGDIESSKEALERVGLTLHANEAVGGYSAGMRQRLGLAASLLRRPRLLLLDEPTSSLDPAVARQVRQLLRAISDKGASVLLSSHNLAEVEELCAGVTVLDRGHIVYSGSVEQLRRLAPAAAHRLHTSDDEAALDLGGRMNGIWAARAARGGLEVSGDLERLDEFVIALGRVGVAVRRLEHDERSLESLFFQLTADRATGREAAPDSVDGRVGPDSTENRCSAVGS
jgi:ABC-2 type transport system ATP-binding protein